MARDESFSQQLRAARAASGLTLRALADRTRINYTKLCQFEHGLVPKPAETRALASVLAAAVAEALGGRHVA